MLYSRHAKTLARDGDAKQLQLYRNSMLFNFNEIAARSIWINSESHISHFPGIGGNWQKLTALTHIVLQRSLCSITVCFAKNNGKNGGCHLALRTIYELMHKFNWCIIYHHIYCSIRDEYFDRSVSIRTWYPPWGLFGRMFFFFFLLLTQFDNRWQSSSWLLMFSAKCYEWVTIDNWQVCEWLT